MLKIRETLSLCKCVTISLSLLVFSLFVAGCSLFDNGIKGKLSNSETSPIGFEVSIFDVELAETDSNKLYETSLRIGFSKPLTADIVVSYAISDLYSTQGVDYIVDENEIKVAAGNDEAFIPVQVLGDLMGEGDEGFYVTLTTSSLGNISRAQAYVNIIDDDPIILSVEATYPINGGNWNDYVNYDNTLARLNQLDIACGFFCIHGAEFKKVKAIGQYSCDGLTMEDSLNGFQWICDSSTSPVYFYSQGLKKDKGLTDLVDVASFKLIKVVLSKESLMVAESVESTNWWSNTVQGLADNSGASDPVVDLNSEGTIYTLAVSRASRGIVISADKISLVLLAGASLSPTASVALDCKGGAGVQPCLLLLNKDYSWIEGSYIGSGIFNDSDMGVIVTDHSLLTTLNQLRFMNIVIDALGARAGISLHKSNNTTLENVIVSEAVNGIYNGNANFSKFNRIKLFNNSNTGLLVNNTSNSNQYTNIISSNNGQHGLAGRGLGDRYYNIRVSNNGLDGIADNSLSNPGMYANILSVNNGGDGISFDRSINRGTLINSTFANNGGRGLAVEGEGGIGPRAVFRNISIENNLVGLYVDATESTFDNIHLVNNGTGVLLDVNSDANVWTGELLLNNILDCSTNGLGGLSGLNGANCDITGNSTAQKSQGVAFANLNLGAVVDAVNIHTGISTTFSSITDWISFENSYRVWGKAARGPCVGSEACEISDWSLTPSAVSQLDVLGEFVAQQACPDSVNGETEYHNYPNRIFLYNATEILGDYIGDEDGFCNSNESCIFSSNISSFQENGSLSTETCIFSDGVSPISIKGVKMYGYN